MENIEEKNLLISEQQAEAQASDELNTEELKAVAGGGNPILEGIRDAAQGVSDGLSGENSGESNLNYLGGNIVGKAVDTVGGLIKGK
ncbi:hypothetical protein PQG02_34795 (plasmid) [Nostoc sp. UHCC 0926]|uniref:hypothetical protein n=1 Tax=Nostoc sp. UHCC 0926 TaxID=3025190 RepID=UPI00235F0E57|nr:hypothetical protein [Nostoc sp. UHCC 0926]WDD36992.1 hypothetical protein PQG02_34795 [Nostoc sp. UHCC 0926]